MENKHGKEWRNQSNSRKTDEKQVDKPVLGANEQCEQMEQYYNTFSTFRTQNTQHRCLAHCLAYSRKNILNNKERVKIA